MSGTEDTVTSVRGLIHQFATHAITADELVTRLASLTYPPAPRTVGEHDDLLPLHPLDMLVDAHSVGLVDDQLYERIADAIEQNADPSRPPRPEKTRSTPW